MGGGQGRAAASGVSLGSRRGSHIRCDVEIGESLEITDAFAGALQGASAQVSSGLGSLTGHGERASTSGHFRQRPSPWAAVPRLDSCPACSEHRACGGPSRKQEGCPPCDHRPEIPRCPHGCLPVNYDGTSGKRQRHCSGQGPRRSEHLLFAGEPSVCPLGTEGVGCREGGSQAFPITSPPGGPLPPVPPSLRTTGGLRLPPLPVMGCGLPGSCTSSARLQGAPPSTATQTARRAE